MMRATSKIKKFFVLTFSILPLLMASSLQAATPKTTPVFAPFTSRAGAFTVLMPGRPEYKTETIKTDNGPVVLHKYIADAQNGKYAYLIAYSDVRGQIKPSELFDYTRQDVIKILKGRLISERPASLDGFPGRVLRAENSEHIAIIKMYLVNKRFYKQIFVMPKGSAYPSDADRFFASFKVSPNGNQLASR